MQFIQHQNSQRANSIFINDIFSLIYSYVSILESKQVQDILPRKTSRHSYTIRENFNYNEISQNAKHDLKKLSMVQN